MKLQRLLAPILAAATLAGSGYLYAETVVTTTSDGTIGDFASDYFTIRSETATAPVRYGISGSTVYVDEAGAPVTVERIRTEHLPVTVHYIKEGDRLIANRVIVHKRVIAAPATVEERKTTTTTITK
jgi:hypothetical protein